LHSRLDNLSQMNYPYLKKTTKRETESMNTDLDFFINDKTERSSNRESSKLRERKVDTVGTLLKRN
jgi:hypothetical protein